MLVVAIYSQFTDRISYTNKILIESKMEPAKEVEELPTISLEDFELLPYELKCQSISHVTDYDQILALRLVSLEMQQLLQNCVTEVTRNATVKRENINILLSLRHLEETEHNVAFDTESIGDIINVANMPYLHSTSITMDLEMINLSYDRALVIFIDQYCQGKYIEADFSTGLTYVIRHRRDLRRANFFFTSFDINNGEDIIIIKKGVVSISAKSLAVFEHALYTLAKYESLRGIELSLPLSLNIITFLLSVPELRSL